MANMIARLGVLLGLDTAEFNKGLADAGRKLDEFVGHAQRGAALAATAFVGLTAKAMQYADEIADVAKANDVAIDSVIKLQNALANSGGSAENAGKLLSSFSSYVDKAAEGSFEAQKLFTKLGVSFQDLGKLSTEELMNKAIKGIAAIDDPITRAAKGMEVFGKAAKGVDFRGLADGIEQMSGTTDSQADAIEKLADLYDKLAQAGRDFMLEFSTQIGPSLKATIDYLEQLKNGGLSFGIVFKTVFDTLAVLGANIAFVFRTIAGEIALTYEQAKALITLDFKKFGQVYDEYEERFKRNRAELDSFERRILGDAGGGRGFINPPIVGGGGVAPGRSTKIGVDPEEEKRKKEKEKEEKRLSEMYAKAHKARLQEQADIDAEVISYGRLTSSISEYQDAEERRFAVSEKLADLDSRRLSMSEYEFQYQRELINLNYQNAEAIRKLEETSLKPSDREAAIKRQNDLYKRQADLLKQIRDIEEAKKFGTTGEGFMAAAKDFFKNLPSDAETGAVMFGSMMMNMQRGLDQFVRTGKLNFKDFARSVILDLVAIQMKAMALKFLGNILGFTATTASGPSTTVPVVDITPRADGGDVLGQQPYLVGERGPELFVPRMSGSIIPNRELGGVGGVTNVTNNYINAIDVKSFEERLMGSSNTIWAANIYAQKRLPVGVGRM